MELLSHKGYNGSIETSLSDDVLHGKILFINDLVTFEAESVAQLKAEFVAAVDDYLETCDAIGKKPEKALSGQFNVRILPEQHKALTVKALQQEKSLNAVMADAVDAYLAKDSAVQNHHHTHAHEVTVKLENAAWSSAVATGQPQFFNQNAPRPTHH
jgi:predicted HicB family RNase H-like nuclease